MRSISKTIDMQNQVIQVQNVSAEEFKNEILKGVKEILGNYLETKKYEEKLLTRKEISEVLSISLPTLRSYVKRGVIQEHRVGSRVLYKWSDVMDALPATNRKGGKQ